MKRFSHGRSNLGGDGASAKGAAKGNDSNKGDSAGDVVNKNNVTNYGDAPKGNASTKGDSAGAVVAKKNVSKGDYAGEGDVVAQKKGTGMAVAGDNTTKNYLEVATQKDTGVFNASAKATTLKAVVDVGASVSKVAVAEGTKKGFYVESCCSCWCICL